MTQTAKGQNKGQAPLQRPGQRKQERKERLARRRRRRQIAISSIAASLVVVLAVFLLWQYQQANAAREAAATKLKDQQTTATAQVQATSESKAGATATADANVKVTATVQVRTTAIAKGMQSVTDGKPTPTAGPASPPAVTGEIKKLPDGLQYIDIKQGTGEAAQNGKTVYVQYTGWVQSNGKKFDSSYDRKGQPIDVPLGQGKVIKGWEEGLVGLKVGGTRRLIIPPALAYGDQSPQGSNIPPNSTLIFDVSLVALE